MNLHPPLDRRTFLKGITAGAGLLAGGVGPLAWSGLAETTQAPAPSDYQGPRVILIRFGGGVRRRESIQSDTSYSPFLARDLVGRGTLFNRMEIAQIKGLETSHGEGTLNIVTGKYDQYKDVGGKFLGARFEPKVPTLFEYLREKYQVPAHQTLIVNGEDRPDEEFYTFSNHHAYGINYRSTMLSLYRYKKFLLDRQIQSGTASRETLKKDRKALEKWEKNDIRTGGQELQGPEMVQFWEKWQAYYGTNGLLNPRGDRLLTELTLWALKELRPKMILVNYNDCDYVHWGNLSHYTRGITIMDEGLRQIVGAVEADPEYRDNTVFAIVPDCGRDTNPYSEVPCQHHFGSKSAHDIFALFFGTGIQKGVVVDKVVDQTSVAGTIARIMDFKAHLAESHILGEVFA